MPLERKNSRLTLNLMVIKIREIGPRSGLAISEFRQSEFMWSLVEQV